jgi:hypothetical protein
MAAECTHTYDQKKVLEMLYEHALKEEWEIKKSVELGSPAGTTLLIPQLVATIDLKYDNPSLRLEGLFRKEGAYRCPFLNVDYSNFSWSDFVEDEKEEHENDETLVKTLLNREKVYTSDVWQGIYRFSIWFPFQSETEAKIELERILQMIKTENMSLSNAFLEQGYKLEQKMIRLPFKNEGSVKRKERVESKSLKEAGKELFEFARSTKIIPDQAIENQ